MHITDNVQSVNDITLNVAYNTSSSKIDQLMYELNRERILYYNVIILYCV